MTTSTVAK